MRMMMINLHEFLSKLAWTQADISIIYKFLITCPDDKTLTITILWNVESKGRQPQSGRKTCLILLLIYISPLYLLLYLFRTNDCKKCHE